jgi:hypothetical protein
MHAGADNIKDCHFQKAQICSIYIDGKRVPSTGNYVFTGCVFEHNPGITIYVTNFADRGSFSGGLLFEHIWFEEGAKDSTPRLINGVSYTPTVLVALDTNVNFENTNTISCNLTRSNLFYNNCSDLVTVDCLIQKDSRSSVVVSNLRLTVGEYYDKNPIVPNNNYFTRDFIYEQAPTYENITVATRTKSRSVISQRSEGVLGSETFADKVSYNIDGQLGTVNSQTPNFVVKDGLLFNRCLEISNLPNGVGWLDNNILLNITNGKYILWTLDAKLINGESFSFALASYNGRRFSRNVNVTSKTWVSYLGAGYISTDAQLTSLEIKQSTGTVSRISAFQCLSFDTLQDMVDYAESGIFSSKQNIRNSISEAAPLVGSYTKGDLIYNTNPTPGGYVGWICTASGTPGTWNTFGAIN